MPPMLPFIPLMHTLSLPARDGRDGEPAGCRWTNRRRVADLEPSAGAARFCESDEWAALVRLEGECPHPAHRFVVGE